MKCEFCQGKGRMLHAPTEKCPWCKGEGTIDPKARIGCTTCQGQGSVIKPVHNRATGAIESWERETCLTCKGSGTANAGEVNQAEADRMQAFALGNQLLAGEITWEEVKVKFGMSDGVRVTLEGHEPPAEKPKRRSKKETVAA